MPTYTINLDGKTIKLKGDREPTEAETREAVNNYFKSLEVEDHFNVPEEERVSKSLTDKDVKQKESSGNPLVLDKKPTLSIQDKVYSHLINTEGASGDTATGIPTGALGLTTKLYDSIKKKTGNSKMTEEEASRYYIDELYNNLSSLPGFTKLNDDEQVILVDTAYNVGWDNMSQWKGFAKGLATGNKEDAFRNLLDTANTEGGTSKGIAKRRALAYNEAFPNNKITHVVQTKDGLEYYKGKKLYFKYDTPPHKSSKIGTLKL